MKKIMLMILLIPVSIAFGQNKSDTQSYKVFGYIISRYEANLSKAQSDFSVKFARLGVKGNVNEFAAYKLMVDFTVFGGMNTTSDTLNGEKVITGVDASFSNALVDAMVTIKPLSDLVVSMGQFKVPFSTENLVSASGYMFSNRSFTKKVTPGLRDIGLMVEYGNIEGLPVTVSGGLFNGSGMNNSETDKTVNYSARINIEPVSNFSVAGNYYGGRMSNFDVKIFDVSAEYSLKKLAVWAEYVQRKSEANIFSFDSKAYTIYSQYKISIDNSIISHIVPALRYDNYDPTTLIDNNNLNRFTAGLSFEFAKINFARLRLNYETTNNRAASETQNMFIIDLQAKF